MDRDEALRLLRGGPEGVEEWNQRRKAEEEIPDLSMALLRGVNLNGADLSDANLNAANLIRSNFFMVKQHLEGVVALMSVATSWEQFKEWVDRRYPKYNETMRLPFRDDDDAADDGQSGA
jgi:hypothetical protein